MLKILLEQGLVYKQLHLVFVLISLLERRLDAVVYRLNLVPTIFSARQLINHGHVRVNGKRVNIRSYMCSVGDVVSIREASKDHPLVLEASNTRGWSFDASLIETTSPTEHI